MIHKLEETLASTRSCCNQPGWNSVEDKFSRVLRRFRQRSNKSVRGDRGSLFVEGISLLLRMVSRRRKEMILNVVDYLWSNGLHNLCRCACWTILKKFSGYCKMAGQQLCRFWQDLVLWEMFLGYYDPLKEPLQSDDVHQWLRDVPEWRGTVTRGQFL